MPYHSPRTLSRLLMAEGDIRAQGAHNAGQAWAGMSDAIGRTVAGTLANLQDERAYKQKQAVADREAAKQHAIDSVLRKSVDPVTGRPDNAMAAREIQQIDPAKAVEWWSRASADEKAQVAKEKETMAQVSQAAGAILAADPTQRPALYQQARSSMIERGMVQPEQVPEVYDEGWLTQTHRSALTVAQQIEAVETAVSQSMQRDRDAETKRHNQTMEGRVTFGAPEKAMVNGKPGFIRAGSDGKVYGLDGRPLDASTVQQMPEKQPAPEKPAGGITPAQKAAAERWKQGELARLEREFRASQSQKPVLNPETNTFETPAPMSREQLEAEKARIQSSYLEQIGAAGTAPPAAAPAAAPQPPAAMPKVQPVASHGRAKQTKGTPPPVDQREVGHIHTFSNGNTGRWDGRTWVKVS